MPAPGMDLDVPVYEDVQYQADLAHKQDKQEQQNMATYTPAQRAALSFAALDRAGADWRHGIDRKRLSFTEPFQDPATQLSGSLAACFAKLHLAPGSAAGLGFAALERPDGTVSEQDAEALRLMWLLLLTPADGT